MALLDAKWEFKRRYGARTLLYAPENPVLRAGFHLRREPLRSIGITDFYGKGAECMIDPRYDTAGYRAIAEEADAVARVLAAQLEAEIEENRRRSRERLAALDVEVERLKRERVEVALADLREILAERPWLLTGKLAGEAAELAAMEDLDGHQWRRARKIADNAGATLKRAEGTLAEVALEHADAVERCADPALRAAILQGCRYLSADDEDMASEANGVGWSRSTTVLGHVLAGKSILSVTEAAHGLGLLKTHRGQLPRDLRIQIGI